MKKFIVKHFYIFRSMCRHNLVANFGDFNEIYSHCVWLNIRNLRKTLSKHQTNIDKRSIWHLLYTEIRLWLRTASHMTDDFIQQNTVFEHYRNAGRKYRSSRCTHSKWKCDERKNNFKIFEWISVLTLVLLFNVPIQHKTFNQNPFDEMCIQIKICAVLQYLCYRYYLMSAVASW